MKKPEIVLPIVVLALAVGCQPQEERLRHKEEQSMTDMKWEIEVGSDREIEIAGGERHVWTWSLPAGQFARVEVQQRGIDVKVRLFAPTSEVAELEVDGLNGEWGTERLSAIAEEADVDYRIEIVAGAAAAAPGVYRLVASRPTVATETDRRNVGAERLFDSAERLRRRRDEDGLRQALDGYRQALDTFEDTGEIEGRIAALHGLGWVYERLGLGEQARQIYQELLTFSREIGRRAVEAETINRLGRIHYVEGKDSEAERLFRQALVIAEELGDESLRATCFNNLASISYRQEDLATALQQFEGVRQIWEQLNRPREQADALYNLGLVLRAQGRFEDAVDAFEKARDLRLQTEDEPDVATILLQIGTLWRWLGEPRKAREVYQQALDMGADKLPGGSRVTLANNLGLILAELGEEEQAVERFEEALAEARRLKLVRYEAMAALNLGALRRTAGQLRESLDLVRRARELFDGLGDHRNLAACGLVEALALRDSGQPEIALATLEAAVEQVEALRLDHAGWDFRMAFFATRQGYYDELIDLLLHMHRVGGDASYLERALHASERRRARSLLDALAESKLHYRGDPELLDRERRFTAELAEIDSELRLHREQRLTAELAESESELRVPDVAERDKLERQRRHLILQLESTRTTIRRASPQYSELTRPQPLGIDAIRTEVLDAGTRLLVYSLGDRRSFLWTLGRKDALEVFELPGRLEIETQIAEARQALDSRSQARQTSHRQKLERISDVLLGPLAGTLDGRRLAVVADGALQTIPFSALPEPAPGSSTGATRRWLIEGREVVHLPSASTLAALRSEVRDRRPAAYAVAVFADPVFSASDLRLQSPGGVHPGEREPVPELERALRDFDSLAGLPRLPATADEAEVIARLVDPRHRLMAVSFDASRKTFEEIDLTKFRVLHFATHGLLDAVHPELSGLVLSLVDEQGRAVDGFIRAHELYTRPLAADLVVLSACQTGLGREVRGEGLVGLPRGFLYAGVPRVVVSLWNVADRSTAELMKVFYQGLDGGLAPSAALRKAQVAMLASENESFRLPFYWGAFAFVGDWRKEGDLGKGIDQDDQGGVVIEDPDKGTAYDKSGDVLEAALRVPETPADSQLWGRAWEAAPMDALQHPTDFVNGVQAETGSFLSHDPDDGSESLRLGPRNFRRLRHWVENYHPADPNRLPMHGVDPEDLAQAGWAVIYGPDVSREDREALGQLISARRGQARDLFREIDLVSGTDALSFLENEAGAFGPAVPTKLPYYLLLVGDPALLPFEFQYQVDVQYAVGRLHFDQTDDYARYAQAVVDAERAGAGNREGVFWGTDIPGDRNAQWMMEGLVRPLVTDLQAWRKQRGLYDVDLASDGRRATLARLLGEAPPAFLFTASHGMVFSSDPTVQREYQGAFLCEDWGMKLQGQAVKREHFFAAEDLPRDGDLGGLIAFHFACYSAGCSERDVFEDGMLGRRRRLAPQAFVSRLSQRLLTSGAQAVVGHVDRAWKTSFTWKNEGDQARVFTSMLRQLFEGHRLGHATEWVHYRYAECSTQLSPLLEAKLTEARMGTEGPDTERFKELRKATLDARNYMVIGDPAVRLVGAEERRFRQSVRDASSDLPAEDKTSMDSRG